MSTAPKKVLVVFGTRPEAIKMAPLVLELRRRSETFQTMVCVTGQHRQMLDQVLSVFRIEPDYDLDIMKTDQDLFDITATVLLRLRDLLKQLSPDIVLVHGDTSTSFAASLAAFYERIPAGHVEAGLRTRNLSAPWPEEANRQLTDRICAYHFAPTESNANNLGLEQILSQHILITGNTVIDALQQVSRRLQVDDGLVQRTYAALREKGYPIETSSHHRIVLITGHRRENIGEGFVEICQAIRHLSEGFPEVDFVYPVHLNPRVRKPVFEILDRVKNCYLLEPLEYLPFVLLMNKAYLILTDSGGIQEEALGLGKPVLVMRDTTERPEGVEFGTVKLVGADESRIVQEVTDLLTDSKIYSRMANAQNPYGDGSASTRIADYLAEYL